MNFEVLQHFLGSLMGLVERLRAVYHDAHQLTSTVGRQSLEFGQSGLSTARDARSRFRKYPVTTLALVGFCLSLLLRLYLYGRPRRPRRPHRASPLLADAFSSAALDGVWR